MRWSRAKPIGSFRVYHPSSRRVAAHTDTLREARKDAAFWTKTTTSPIEIQERFPSGEWVTIATVSRKFPSKSAVRPKRVHATRRPTRSNLPQPYIPNGRSKGRRPSEFDPVQLRRGTKVEMEHTTNRQLAQRIAMDHLTEDPRYYVKLARIHAD